MSDENRLELTRSMIISIVDAVESVLNRDREDGAIELVLNLHEGYEGLDIPTVKITIVEDGHEVVQEGEYDPENDGPLQ